MLCTNLFLKLLYFIVMGLGLGLGVEETGTERPELFMNYMNAIKTLTMESLLLHIILNKNNVIVEEVILAYFKNKFM